MDNCSDSLINLINEIPRNVFHHKIIRGVSQNLAYGHLVSAGANDLSEEEKQTIRKLLSEVGVPIESMKDNESLDIIANAIASRSVTLR